MLCLCPKGYAAIFQPLVQLAQIFEDRHDLPHATAGIPNILLDLAFLPACSRIAKFWLKDVMVGHSLEPRVDVSLFATPDAIDRSLHIVIDAAPWDDAEHTECMPMRIKNARQCDSLVCATCSLTRSPPMVAQFSLQPNWNTKGTNVPRPVVCSTRCRSSRHTRAKAATRA